MKNQFKNQLELESVLEKVRDTTQICENSMLVHGRNPTKEELDENKKAIKEFCKAFGLTR